MPTNSWRLIGRLAASFVTAGLIGGAALGLAASANAATAPAFRPGETTFVTAPAAPVKKAQVARGQEVTRKAPAPAAPAKPTAPARGLETRR